MLIDLFLKIVNMSIGAVPLMLAILVLRWIFKGKVPRKVFYLAWTLVFIRLMVPFSIESDLSFFSLLPESYVTETERGPSLEFVKDRGETFDFPVLSHPAENNPSVDAVAPEESEQIPLPEEKPVQKPSSPVIETSPLDKNFVFAMVWAFGSAALLLFGVAGYLAVLKKVKFESVSYSKNIYLCDFFSTPMVCGFVKPKIILPLTFNFDDESKVNSVLLHEHTHINRKDNFRRLLATFTLYVHWFNPLVWVCYWAFIRDMEVSCDEEVLRKSKKDIRGEYAESLVSLAGGGTNPLYGGVLSFGETAIKERVKCIMNFKKAKTLIIIICCAAALALGVIFLTNPAAPKSSNSFEVIPNDSGEAVFDWEDGAKVSFKIKNTGTKTVYAGESTIYKWEDEHNMWIPAMNFYAESPDYTGTTAILPGETITVNEKIPVDIIDAFDLICGKYYLSRHIYSDAEKTQSLGSAKFEFMMDAAFSGYVATEHYHIPMRADYGQNQRYGNEEELAYFKEIIDSLDISDVKEFVAINPVNVGDLKIAVGPSVAKEFITLLKTVDPFVAESVEPEPGVGKQIYFQTADKKFNVYYDGRIIFYEEGEKVGITFGAGNKGPFEQMGKAIEEIILNPPTLSEADRHYPFSGKIVYAEEFEGDVIKLPSEIRYSMGGEGVTVTEYISKITAENVTEIYLYRTPYSGRVSLEMDFETGAKILHYLSATRATYPTKSGYDFSDEGTHICVKSMEGLVYYLRLGSDGFLTFYTPGNNEAVVYDGEDCQMAFDAINSLADSLMGENAVNPPVAADENFTGFATTENFKIPFSNAGGKKVGTAADAENALEIIKGVKAKDLEEMTVLFAPHDLEQTISFNKDTALYILSLLQASEFELVEDFQNPSGAGSVWIYIKTAKEEFCLTYNGTVDFMQKGASNTLCFGCGAMESAMLKVHSLANDIFANYSYANGDSTSLVGEKIPVIADTEYVTLFNNTEKTCTEMLPLVRGKVGSNIYWSLYDGVFPSISRFDKNTDYSQLGKAIAGCDSIEFSRFDGKKYTVSFYEKGFTFSGSAAEQSDVGMYLVEEGTWGKFLAEMEKFAGDCKFEHASWLGLIHSGRVTSITVKSNEFSEKREYTKDNEPGIINSIVSHLKTMVVKPNPTRENWVGNRNSHYVNFEILFTNGNRYLIFVDEEYLAVASDDMSYSLVYTLNGGAGRKYYEELAQLAKEDHEINVTTG